MNDTCLQLLWDTPFKISHWYHSRKWAFILGLYLSFKIFISGDGYTISFGVQIFSKHVTKQSKSSDWFTKKNNFEPWLSTGCRSVIFKTIYVFFWWYTGLLVITVVETTQLIMTRDCSRFENALTCTFVCDHLFCYFSFFLLIFLFIFFFLLDFISTDYFIFPLVLSVFSLSFCLSFCLLSVDFFVLLFIYHFSFSSYFFYCFSWSLCVDNRLN